MWWERKGQAQAAFNAFLCASSSSAKGTLETRGTQGPNTLNSTVLLAQPHCAYTSLSHDEGQGTSPWLKG